MSEPNAEPLVSIVTPVLNRASTIRACLSSVSAQTYPAIEHIVVDGGSTDGTLEIVQSFSSRHALRWMSEPDEGMYDAINKGITLANGAVIAYVNSDDYYVPWSVEVAVAALRKGTDLVYGDLALIKRKDNSLRPKFYLPFDLNYYTYAAAIAQPTVFWKASVTEQIGGFDTDYKLLGDCEYWVRAATAGLTVSHIDEVLAVQVEHEGTLRATRPQDLEKEQVQLRDSYRAAAGDPSNEGWRSWQQKMRLRRRHLQFILAAQRQHPTRWPRFLGFLSEHGLDVRRAEFFWYLLPSRSWPRQLAVLDATGFERHVLPRPD